MRKIVLFLSIFLFLINLNAKTLIVGTDANYPPFEYRDVDNNIVGFDMDLLALLAKKIGFKYEIVDMSFGDLFKALQDKKIDLIMAGISVTQERKELVDFSDPYLKTSNIFIKDEGDEELNFSPFTRLRGCLFSGQNKNKLNSKKDLKGKKIAVQKASLQEKLAKNIEGAIIFSVDDIFDGIMALMDGKIDAVFTDNLVGLNYVKANKSLKIFLEEPDGSEGFAIAFRKDEYTDLIEQINDALEDIKIYGSLNQLERKYNIK